MEQRSENLNDIEEEKDNVKSLIKPSQETTDIGESVNSQNMNYKLQAQSMSMQKTLSLVTDSGES